MKTILGASAGAQVRSGHDGTDWRKVRPIEPLNSSSRATTLSVSRRSAVVRRAEMHAAYLARRKLAHQPHQRLLENVFGPHRPGGQHFVDLRTREHDPERALVVARVRILPTQFRERRRQGLRL